MQKPTLATLRSGTEKLNLQSSCMTTGDLLILFEMLLDKWYHFKHSENTKKGIKRKKELDKKKGLIKIATEWQDLEEWV